MAEILACRVCLATDVKLFDIYSNKLISSYETVTGIQVKTTDRLPKKMCSYCSVMTIKTAAFKERCVNTNELLGYLAETELITTDFLRRMDRTDHQPSPPFTIERLSLMSNEINEIKEEEIDFHDLDVDAIGNDIKSEASDEEPLSSKIKKNNKPETVEELAPEIDLLFLSKMEQMNELRERMNTHNYLNSLYKCELCYKGFMTDVTFKNHMLRHDPKAGKHRCEVCSIYCTSLRTLKSHTTASHERKYICKLCNYITKSGSRAREHSRWHLGHTYVCQLCGANFAKSTSYFTHVRLSHPSRHSCALCGESFVGANGLNMHVKKTHALQDRGALTRNCNTCDTKFNNDEALRRHSELKDCDVNKRSCSQCGESFNTNEKLNEHIKMAHEATKCEECDKTFTSERSYAIHHQRIHLGVRVKRHNRRTDSGKVVCERCGISCHSKANLMYHQRTHTGERPYLCKLCPKKFANLQLLQIHIRTHTGERPYKCEVCAKGFIHKAGLNRHVRVHTGEKPYVCPHCEKAFSQSNSMKLHVNTVHLKMPAPYRGRKKEFV